MEEMKVKTLSGKELNAKLFKAGEPLRHGEAAKKDTVEFWLGNQFVGDYHVETLLKDWITGEPLNDGLMLRGNDVIPAAAMNELRKALRKQEDGEGYLPRLAGIASLFRAAAEGLQQSHFDATIRVEVKSIYGQDKIYIVSGHKDAILALTGKKTIDEDDMKALKALGFHIFDQTGRTWV